MQEKTSTAKLTEEYIQGHPSIKDCIKKEIINYSALARQIAENIGTDRQSTFDAILVACRRYSRKMKLPQEKEKQILDLLKNGKLEVRNKITVFAVSSKAPLSEIVKIAKKIADKDGTFHLIQGSKAVTIIADAEFSHIIKENLKGVILDTKDNLVAVSLIASPEIREISGVNAYIYSLFAENDINILDTMDAWTDNIFIIAEKDIQKTMDILKF